MNPEYTTPTADLGEFTLAVYICPDCEREFYDDEETGEPSFCPYCGSDVDADEDVRTTRYDKRAAFLTMDALERQVVHAVAYEEFEVAAETAEALFLLQAELPEWTDEYHRISGEFPVDENLIGDAMAQVYEWTVEEDHKAREWFEEEEEE